MFKDNLLELRKLNDMSQEELADLIGVSRQTLSKYETGESLPDIEKCKLIADIFGVSIDDLLNYDPKDSENLGTLIEYDSLANCWFQPLTQRQAYFRACEDGRQGPDRNSCQGP